MCVVAGPKLGDGPRWAMSAVAGGEGEAEKDPALLRCERMLAQALACSPVTDVRFKFDDGAFGVAGHWGMLCGGSAEFVGMFESGMAEAATGEVRVRGVSRESFRGFLEFAYTGEWRGVWMGPCCQCWCWPFALCVPLFFDCVFIQ